MDRKKLAYDVFVNVVANLIAAAIIFLLGAYFGFFPATVPTLVLASTFLVTPPLLAAGVYFHRRRSVAGADGIVTITHAVAGLASIALFFSFIPDTGILVIGCLTLAGSVLLALF